MKITLPDWYKPTPGLIECINKEMHKPFALLLTGAPGCGKTLLANLIADTIYKHHKHDGNFTVWRNTSSGTYQAYLEALADNSNSKELTKMYNILNRSLVVFDDLGCERDTAAAASYIEDIVCNHYDFVKTHGYNYIIMTSNANIDQIEELYGERVSDRIGEIFLIINMKDKSHRRKHRRIKTF